MIRKLSGMCCLAFGMLIGCGGSDLKAPKTNQVTGTVTFQGKTIEKATVSFIPNDSKVSGASGYTDAQGIYKLMTDGRFEGAAEGSYKVTIVKVETSGNVAMTTDDPNYGKESKIKTTYIIPQKYGDATKSGLTATVKAGKNDIPFDLK
jgi:hypothetical protein